MATPLNGKVFAITGGASGIGLATAKILSSRGAIVCIGDIDPAALSAAETLFNTQAASGPAPHKVTRLDVTNRLEVDAWIEGIVSTFGRLDGAANVAGIIGKAHGKDAVVDLDDDEWDHILKVNLTGMMYCLRAELRRVWAGGSIVNVSSIHGVKGTFHLSPLNYTFLTFHPPGFAQHAAYDASKHGVIGLTKAAAQENGPREVRVNAVAPGAIYTPLMQKHWDSAGRAPDAPFDDPSAIRRQGTAEEVASVIAFLLGPESTFVSGSVYAVDGAWI